MNQSQAQLAGLLLGNKQLCIQKFPTNWFLTPFPLGLYKYRAVAGGWRGKAGLWWAPGPGKSWQVRCTCWVISHRGRGSVALRDGNPLGFVFHRAILNLCSTEIYMSHRKYCSVPPFNAHPQNTQLLHPFALCFSVSDQQRKGSQPPLCG